MSTMHVSRGASQESSARTLRNGIALAILFLGVSLPTLASAQVWLEWQNVTGSNIIADPSVGANDVEEKDFATGDFDLDGDVDLLVVRKLPFTTFGNRPNVLFLNIDGVLTDATATLAPGLLTPDNARDVMVGNFNGDPWPDFVIANAGNQSSNGQQPRIFINQGNDPVSGAWLGFVEEPGRLPFLVSPTGSEPNACAVGVGDLNQDGFDDLYLVDYQNDMEDRLLMNDGTGFFTDESSMLPATFLQSAFATAGLIADMNGDGWPEILKDTTPSLRIAYNDGAGNFPITENPSVSAMYHFDVGDLDGDNLNDVFAVQDPQDQFLLNASAVGASPVTWQNTALGNSPLTSGFGGNVYIEDLDGDGDNDVTVTDVDTDVGGCARRLAFLRNDGGSPVSISDPWGNGPYSPAHHLGTFDVALADFNGDGAMDVWVGHCGGNDLYFQTSNIPGIVPPGSVACPQVGLDVALTWTNEANYEAITIRRDGVPMLTLPGTATSFTDVNPPSGVHSYSLYARIGADESAPSSCVIQVSVVDPILNVTCDQVDENVDLTWTNQAPIAGGTYSGIRVVRNGIDIALLPGDTTSFTDLGPSFGLTNYQLIALSGAEESVPTLCSVQVIPTNLTDLVVGFTADDNGATDSTAAIQNALADNGVFSVIAEVDGLADLAGLGYVLADFDRVWVELGTFPNKKTLSSTEGQMLADYVTAGGFLYISGSDFFCLDPDTALHALTGVNTGPGGCTDGISGIVDVGGVSVTDCELQNFSIDLVPFSGESIFVDQLTPLTTGVEILAANNMTIPVGVLNVLPGGGAVVSQSIEMGGIGVDHDKKDLVERYMTCFLGGVPPAPVAEFAANPISGDAPLVVDFTNLSAGAIDTFAWDFGDGNTSSDPAPTHTFGPGVFTVSLTVTGPGGSDTATLNNLINAVAAGPGFVRGDADGDGGTAIGDAIGALSYLFGGTEPAGDCRAALDYGDDGSIDISDPIGLLGYLFSGGAEPAAPFPDCGLDPTPDTLTCNAGPCP